MKTIMDDEDEISILQWFQWKLLTLDKNWSAFTENISIAAIGLISASLVTAVLTWILTKDNVSNQDTPNIVDKTKSVGNATRQNIQKERVDSSGSNLRNRKGRLFFYQNFISSRNFESDLIIRIQRLKHLSFNDLRKR